MTLGAGTSQNLPQQGQCQGGAEHPSPLHCTSHIELKAAALGQFLTNKYPVTLDCFWWIQTFRDLGIIVTSKNMTIICLGTHPKPQQSACQSSVWTIPGVLSSERCSTKEWHGGWTCSNNSECWHLLLGHRAFSCPFPSVGCSLTTGKPLLGVTFSAGRRTDGWLCVGCNAC